MKGCVVMINCYCVFLVVCMGMGMSMDMYGGHVMSLGVWVILTSLLAK
jgi:hypothetical protein